MIIYEVGFVVFVGWRRGDRWIRVIKVESLLFFGKGWGRRFGWWFR